MRQHHIIARAIAVAIAGSTLAVGGGALARGDEAKTMVAVSLFVDASVRSQVTPADVERYETYVRTLLSSLVPGLPVITEEPGEAVATHVLQVDFTPREDGKVRMTVNVKVGRSTARRMDLGKSASTVVAPSDHAAVEDFLRRQVKRIIGLYKLHAPRVAAVGAADPPPDETIHTTELGIRLVMDPQVTRPKVEAVSSVIRTVLSEQLPGVTLIGSAEAGPGSAPRPVLAIEIRRFVTTVSGGASATPAKDSEHIVQGQISVILTNFEGRELFRADDVYDLEDEARALAFLRASLLSAAQKLTPLVPLVATAPVPEPVVIPIDRERGDPTGEHAGSPHAAPPPHPAPSVSASRTTSSTRRDWRPLRRTAELSVAGVGVILLGVGTSYGLQARDWEQQYRRADNQLDAATAKRRSEHEGRTANRWFLVGGITAGVAAVALSLDLFGVFDRGASRAPDRKVAAPATTSLHVLPTDGGMVSVWSVYLP